MKLILTRHGETEENRIGVIQGHLPGVLSKNGIKQAKRVAERLKDEKIDHIYSSDLARSADTTKEIAKYHSGVSIEFVQDLRERYYGEWQGKYKEEVGYTAKTDLTKISPKNGETFDELYNRANNFLHQILKLHQKDVILFVGHSVINRAITAVITNKSPHDIQHIERLGNTSISIYEIGEDKEHKIHLYNCTSHLE